MALSDEDIREILRIIDETPLAELEIETDGFSLRVRRGEAAADAARGQPVARAADTTLATEARQATDVGRAAAGAEPVAAGHTVASATREPTAGSPQDGVVTIASPMLGTFYRSEGPGQPPFVEVGSRVEPDTIVCIIEVMKMMNSVPAGVSGTIVEILPDNAQLVEYGQPLFRVKTQ
jgi:acetyl-CoA carboxylase biotin carboxyl carrier protein